MARALDLMYSSFIDIASEGDLFLDEDYVMNIFKPLYGELPELDEYLTYYFEEKEANVVGSNKECDRVLAIDGAVAELFYPTRMENRQSTPTCRELAVKLAIRGMAECVHPKKAIADHLSIINGKKSWIEISEDEKLATLGLRANNDPAEENFAVFSDAFENHKRMRLDNAAGEGQARYNNDYDRGYSELVSGKKGKTNNEPIGPTIGYFHQIDSLLQNSLLITRKLKAHVDRNNFTLATNRQALMAASKMKAKRNKKLKTAEAALIDASYLFQQYSSARCVTTSKEAFDVFEKLTTNVARYKFVKEQILIRYLGLGWTEAYHPYSKAGYTYTPVELMEHFVKTVLPLAKTQLVPQEPPLELPGLPTQLANVKLGTKAADCAALDTNGDEEEEAFRIQAMRKREKLEDSGCGDELQELQQVLWPVDYFRQYSRRKRKFRIDMLFEHIDNETQEKFHVWSRGEIIEVKRITEDKKNEIVVMVCWDEEFVEDVQITKEILMKSKWNMDRPANRAWREDLHHKMLVIN